MPSGCLEAGLRFLLKDSEFVDRKLIRALRYSGTARNPSLILTPVKTGVHPPVPLTWIPFFNGMTDAVRHLDAGRSLSLDCRRAGMTNFHFASKRKPPGKTLKEFFRNL